MSYQRCFLIGSQQHVRQSAIKTPTLKSNEISHNIHVSVVFPKNSMNFKSVSIREHVRCGNYDQVRGSNKSNIINNKKNMATNQLSSGQLSSCWLPAPSFILLLRPFCLSAPPLFIRPELSDALDSDQ